MSATRLVGSSEPKPNGLACGHCDGSARTEFVDSPVEVQEPVRAEGAVSMADFPVAVAGPRAVSLADFPVAAAAAGRLLRVL